MTSGGAQAQYFAFLDEGRFMLQRRVGTNEYVFYPRERAPGDGGPLEWHEVSGLGTVYSCTTVRRRPEQGGSYNVSLIDLDEGVRMMSRVVDIDATDVKIGMRVRARIAMGPDDTEHKMIEFTPEAGA